MAYYDDAYQDPVSFSSYESYGLDNNYDVYNVSEFHEPKSIDHSHYGYDYGYDYGYGNFHNWDLCANPTINYFAHNYMEPKLIAYEPVACDTGHVSYHTQYSISYSKMNSGFNKPEFEEYDPTPYGGGYDIISTYGKPLQPSDQTCYPRSNPKPVGPRPAPNSKPQPETQPTTNHMPLPLPLPAATSIPPVEPKPMPGPQPESKPEPMPMPMPMPMPIATSIPIKSESESESEFETESESETEHALVPVADALEFKESGEREREEYGYPGYGYDYPWPEYDNANVSGFGYDYGYGKQMVQIPPCEYSPEVVDLCESIFGSWPCLARIRKQHMTANNNNNNNPGTSGHEIRHIDPWEDCASYIFGRQIASYNV